MSANLTTRTYIPEESIVFCKTREKWGEFSNMHSGYPITVQVGSRVLPFRSTEHLYQILKHPDDPMLQHEIAETVSPYWAKKVAYKKPSDPTFEPDKLDIMRWMLLLKHTQYPEEFDELLESTEDLPIVELSSHDRFWGAMKQPNGTLEGCNGLGREWMERRSGVDLDHLNLNYRFLIRLHLY